MVHILTNVLKVDMLLDQLTRQFPMRVPPAPAAVEGPRQGFYQPIVPRNIWRFMFLYTDLSGPRTTQPLLLGARQLVGGA